MDVSHAGVALTVNDRSIPVVEFEREMPDVEYVRSISASLPDPGWSVYDSHGHLHQWARAGREAMGRKDSLPTLVGLSRQMPCNGACGGACGGEGYTITVYHCAMCGDEVEPGLIPDYEARDVGIPMRVGVQQITLTTRDVLLDNVNHTAELTRTVDGAVVESRRGTVFPVATWGDPDGAKQKVHFDEGRTDG